MKQYMKQTNKALIVLQWLQMGMLVILPKHDMGIYMDQKGNLRWQDGTAYRSGVNFFLRDCFKMNRGHLIKCIETNSAYNWNGIENLYPLFPKV